MTSIWPSTIDRRDRGWRRYRVKTWQASGATYLPIVPT